MTESDLIRVFVSQARRYGDAGFTRCSSGNLSWRIGEEVLMSGTGSWVPNLKESQVAVCNLESGKVLNDVKPSMEHIFHLGILRKRPEMNVVFHFQSEYATIISCMKNKPADFNVTAEIPLHVGREIPVIPYIRPGSEELALSVISAMEKHNCCLLANHGQVVCGKDFDDVFQRASFFEMACRIIVANQGNCSTLSEKDLKGLEVFTTK